MFYLGNGGGQDLWEAGGNELLMYLTEPVLVFYYYSLFWLDMGAVFERDGYAGRGWLGAFAK